MQCAICRQGTNMGCSLCQKVFYCSRAHQQKHWLKHKNQCDGRIRRVLQSQYNTFSEDNPISRKSSPEAHSKLYYSKQKRQISNTRQRQIQKQRQRQRDRQLSRGRQIQFTQRVNKFVENNEARKDERSKILLDYTKGKEQQLISRSKNLMLFSETMFRQFDNTMCRSLIEKFKIRTSKYIQQLQYLLDVSLLLKLYLKCSMNEELKKLIYSLKLPGLPEKVNILNHNDTNELQNYKLWKQEVTNCKIVLSLLASIANAGGFTSYTQTIYKSYIYLVERSFGINEKFLAYFLVGNWYSEIRQFNKAKCCFEYCIELKRNDKKDEEEIILGDCYFNVALCLRMMNSLNQAIDAMHESLTIRRQRIGKGSLEVGECLEFIGKQLIELAKFHEAVDYLNQCYNIRKRLLKPNDKGMTSLTELIKRLYVETQKKEKEERSKMNDKEADERQKDMKRVVKQFDISKHNEHFFEQFGEQASENRKPEELKLDSEWIEDLGTVELESLTQIIREFETISYKQAIPLVLQSKFYNSLSEQRKQIFRQMNPDLFN